MVGILNNQAGGELPPEAPPQPIGQAEEERPAQEEAEQLSSEYLSEEEPATEQEQESFDRVVTAAMDVMHDESTAPDILKMLEAGKDQPGRAVAQLGVMVFMQLDDQSGGNIPEEVIVQSIEQIMSMAAEMGEEAGFFTFDEQAQKNASESMWQLLTQAGYIDEEEAAQLAQSASPEQQQEIQTKGDQLTGQQPQQAAPPQGAQPQGV